MTTNRRARSCAPCLNFGLQSERLLNNDWNETNNVGGEIAKQDGGANEL
jgi:hypothetical protein